MRQKRKILYVSGTRADYGLIKQTLLSVRRETNLQLEVVATGMHLMPQFGNTVAEIRNDGFRPFIIPAIYKGNERKAMADFIGKFIIEFSRHLAKSKPDIVWVQGDRAEALAAAIAAVYFGIPVVHTHGGETTSTIDESSRHAISKLAHIHLAPTKKAAERLIRMGEDRWRTFVVGAPGLDEIRQHKFFSKQEMADKYRLDLSKPIILVVQHSVSEEEGSAGQQAKETMEAVKELSYQAIVSYPNTDPGSREIITVIERYRKYPFIKIYRNIPHRDFLSLMWLAGAIVGNSSSALIEAPSFYLPAVNIGTRQGGRERSVNVIDIDYKKREIKQAIEKALFDEKFREKVKKGKNPYGDGKAGERIAKILNRVEINQRLLQKKITY